MGSEQSNQGKSVRAGLRRGKSVPEYRADVDLPDEEEEDENIGTNSPEPSVCSDSDLPYISYTVNRPIGGTYMDTIRCSLPLLDSFEYLSLQIHPRKSH